MSNKGSANKDILNYCKNYAHFDGKLFRTEFLGENQYRLFSNRFVDGFEKGRSNYTRTVDGTDIEYGFSRVPRVHFREGTYNVLGWNTRLNMIMFFSENKITDHSEVFEREGYSTKLSLDDADLGISVVIEPLFNLRTPPLKESCQVGSCFALDCLDGSAFLDDIESYIENWLKSETDKTLYNYLGLSAEVFNHYQTTGQLWNLKPVLFSEKYSVPLPPVHNWERGFQLAARSASVDEGEKIVKWLVATGRIPHGS